MATTTKFTALLALGVAISACSNDRQCERDRLALEKSFTQVQLTATDAKKLDEDRAKGMGAAAKQAHTDHWAKLENKAALLRSSVATEQVTWDSASQALTDAKTEYAAGEAKSTFEEGFGTALTQAESAFNDFMSRCR